VLKSGIEGVFEIAMKLIGLVIRMAPLAIFCFMFNLAALFGWDLIVRLSAYVGVVLLALGLQMFGVFPALLVLFGAQEPGRLLSRNPGSKCDGVRHRLLQRDAADLAAGWRTNG
jgi:Na+/H+-dicarboxylate symporter